MLYDTETKETKRLDLGSGTYQDAIWSPDGKYLAFVKILHNEFSIGILNIFTMQSKILTEGYKVESPVFAPNSKYIMFTKRDNERISTKNGISFLFIVDLNGNIIKRVPTPTDASEASWQKIRD
jgi:TolB protein